VYDTSDHVPTSASRSIICRSIDRWLTQSG